MNVPLLRAQPATDLFRAPLGLEQAIDAVPRVSGNTPAKQAPLSPESDAYLAQLRGKLDRLAQENRSREVLAGIPHSYCRLEAPHLRNHEEFFLALYFLDKDPEDCERLAAHLNNCFLCSEVFSEVLRDFHVEDARRLREARMQAGRVGSFVPQDERDGLFIRARYEDGSASDGG